MGAMLRFALRVGLLGAIFVLSYAGDAGLSGGVALEWHDLHYAIATKNGGKLKHILSGLHGRATPGQLVAIMGPTGCGKTSLLNALAARTMACKGATLRGSVLVNGQPRNDGAFRRMSAYVQQDDVLYAHQTVRETLDMAAQLRLHDASSKSERDALVDNLVTQLGLVKAQDTEIGNERVRGVSGGERKRTNLGVELISDPSVIFLDEPTSGLDSFQAESVIQTLKKLACNGRTVFTSIHQPSSQIFAHFDQLLLLSEGQGIYFGPANEAVSYFAGLGHRCPKLFNPADFFLDLLSVDYRSPEALNRTTATVERLAVAYRRSARAQKAMQVNLRIAETPSGQAKKPEGKPKVPIARMRSLRDLLAVGAPSAPEQEIDGGGVQSELRKPRAKYAASWIRQFGALLRRSQREVQRDRTANVIRASTNIIFASALAGLYSKKFVDPQKAIQECFLNAPAMRADRTGALFFIVVNQAFSYIGPALQSFAVERGVVLRERMARSYHVSAYYVAKLISEAPIAVVVPMAFGSIVYPALRLQRNLRRFGTFVAILVLNALAATSLGLVVSAGTNSLKAASSLAPVCMVLMLLFGGFYVNAANIPRSLRWLTRASFVNFSFKALALNEFSGLDIPCPSSASDCVRSGEQVLSRLSFQDDTLYQVLLCEATLVAAINFLAFVLLRRNMPKFEVMLPPPSEQ